MKANRELWDAWASFHPQTEMYRMEAFRNGASSLMPLELQALSRVEGKSLLHLQCHFGQDTISWSRLGALATGVDFSGKAISTARTLATTLNADTDFIQSDVLNLDLGKCFDIVFTSYGVLAWLPDLRRWGAVVAQHLKPGGVFFIAEFHPVLMMFDFGTGKCAYSYFKSSDPYEESVEGSYANPEEGTARTEYTWSYSLSEVISALTEQGLVLESFEEYPYAPYNCFPNMKQRTDGMYESVLLAGAPHLFTLKMRKPG
ncbi:MAG: class I SAM-dependent methyltransferase [Phaeodactylibacter sp.]|uniref:class I SAM-dependent methyltransferase n=1 Tax=Phaeodactylibacter sp. TaxID=1940289 RepID=UPI0032EE5879